MIAVRARRLVGPALVLAMASAPLVWAQVPPTVAQALFDVGIPPANVAMVVQEVGATMPLVTHNADQSMNPASVMKLVTSLAALELLGGDFRWKTEAYLDGPLVGTTLRGNLVIKGYGDPKITIEQWQAFMALLRTRGVWEITGDLILDRSHFKLPRHDSSAFDREPLRPYNVGPDALMVNFKAVRFVFVPDARGLDTAVRVEPPLPGIVVSRTPRLAGRDCGDWRTALKANIVNQPNLATATFAGNFARGCGERDWYVALLDHPRYVFDMFTVYFREAGGRFDGGFRDGLPPQGAQPFVTLESAPLYDIVRDVNKLSNNVMARQIFLTLATARHPPPATTELAASTVKTWLSERRISMPGLVMDNGSGLSRHERLTASGLTNLLAAADASNAREEFASSLAVAATDGTVQRRFQNGTVAGQALLKTGSLEGVRAMAGYVIDASGRRFIVVALVNHPQAARGGAAIDELVQWVYSDAGAAVSPRPR